MNTRNSREILGKLGDKKFLEAGMTELQARRAALIIKGLGPSEAAREEGVSRASLSRSVEGATAKAHGVLNNHETYGTRRQKIKRARNSS